MRIAWSSSDGTIHDRRDAGADDWPRRARAVWADLDLTQDERWLEPVLAHVAHDRTGLATRIIRHERRRPSLLLYPEAVTFLLADMALESGREVSVASERQRALHVVMNRRVLVTAHMAVSERLATAWEETRRGETLAEGVDLALYQVLTAFLSAWERLRGHLIADYESIQAEMLLHPYANLAPRILAARRALLAFNRLLRPEAEIFQLLGSSDFGFVQKTHRAYFQDVTDRMTDLVDEVEATREGLSGTVEAYTSMQSNEINKVVKLLTIISVLSLPATTIASIYGMNFNIPELHWWFGYWYSLALMTSVTLTLLWWVRRHQGFR
ncbi:MAG: magnesium transporter CorA [Thermaerobacter sp.]|nr:magnesium transporter CorA [Thermaerobacter sp.]